jgi:hypothetical protein
MDYTTTIPYMALPSGDQIFLSESVMASVLHQPDLAKVGLPPSLAPPELSVFNMLNALHWQ